MRNFPNKFYRIQTSNAKVRALQIRQLDCVRTLFVPLGNEGLSYGTLKLALLARPLILSLGLNDHYAINIKLR